MKEMKDMMLKNNETVIEQEIVRADNEMRGIEQSLQQVSLISNRDLSAELQQSKQELLAEIQIQKASHDNFRKMCEEALSKTVYERTGQKIKSVKATNNSTALAGIFNMSGEDLKIKQDISDITADNYSVAIAGVVRNVNFKDLRPGGPGSK
jgi:D-ribose pyranose/furanose isomerase RbsD